MKRLHILIVVALFGVAAYFSPMAKMEGRTCIVGGTIARAVINPEFCPSVTKDKEVLLSAKYVSNLQEELIGYSVDGCAARTPGPCVVNDEFPVCRGFIEVKQGKEFQIDCPLYLPQTYTGYFIISLNYKDTSVQPVENFPIVTLLPSSPPSPRKIMLPLITGGVK